MKRTFLKTLLFAFLIIGCSRNNFEPIGTEETILSIPEPQFPTADLTCTNFELEFRWEASPDADREQIQYEITIAEDDGFSAIVFRQTVNGTAVVFTLEQGTTYFWRVRSMDGNGNQSDYSPTLKFFTEPEAVINFIPSPPVLVSPELGTSIPAVGTTLEWTATDADGDPLRYDVYFGTQNPPELLLEDVAFPNIEVDVVPNTQYYWSIVVKDDHQGAAIGSIWDFVTE